MLLYSVPKLASFTLKKYGEEAASSLALFWCKKMQFLYDVWCNQEDEDYVDTPEDVAASNDSEDLSFGWEGSGPDHPCWARLKEIEAIWP